MKGFEQVGIIFRSIFGSNPDTEIEKTYADELATSVEQAVEKYREGVAQEKLGAEVLARSLTNISKRLG